MAETKTRSEQDIATDLARERAAYHDGHATATAAQQQERTAHIKALMKEMSDRLSAGAQPCPKCGNPPLGRLKTPPTKRMRAIYEVGCLACSKRLPDGTLRRAYFSLGTTAAQAVFSWNQGEYAEEV